MINIKTFVFNHFSQNTYLVFDESKEAAIIDSGCFFEQEKQKLLQYIESNNLKLTKIIFTHCHLDHAFGTRFFHDTYNNLEIAGHKNESIFIDDAINQGLRFGIKMEQPPRLTKELEEGDTINVGNSVFEILFVPGHSPGSLCYVNRERKIVFVGDVLFEGSIGRTDLPGGNLDLLLNGIKSKLLTLPDDYIVYSGHGETTTIGNEKKNNPFLK
ncbi:MAG: MBL fold metallo-hydrolase [Bacteroidales bacterium]|nr:MBL fold metallo-hydrolase [Bacteroidales bacterium]